MTDTEEQPVPDWEEVARRHGRFIFSVAYRLTGNEADAQDLVQEVLVDAPARPRLGALEVARTAAVRFSSSAAADRLELVTSFVLHKNGVIAACGICKGEADIRVRHRAADDRFQLGPGHVQILTGGPERPGIDG